MSASNSPELTALGAPGGACAGRNDAQSGVESLMSTLTTPSKRMLMGQPLLVIGTPARKPTAPRPATTRPVTAPRVSLSGQGPIALPNLSFVRSVDERIHQTG